MSPVRDRALARAQFWASSRFHEPVLVLESDDWGLRRRPAAEAVAAWGPPSPWADEHAETGADVAALLAVLDRHRDPHGRPAAMTMNLVTANADAAAIEADGFTRYHDRPIDETLDPEVLTALRGGVDGHLLALELHGRAHLDPDRWLRDLRDDHPGARALLAAGVDGGLSLVSGQGWRYHSELVSWEDGRHRLADELAAWLAPAVATVARIAGRPPRTAVAPHYLLTPEGERAWARLGITAAQATERRPRPGRRPASSYLGRPSSSGLVHLIRTARFDPRPARPGHHVGTAATVVARCFEQGIPAVVDTHRINFAGPWAADARAQLDELLSVADAAGAWYLTSPELAEAVTGPPSFTDRTGVVRELTPVGGAGRAATRVLWGRA